jgi:tetratricopeptide (TPR) repeat protein
LTKRLVDARKRTHDSPIYQLLEHYPDINHTKTDTFREQVEYSKAMKERLVQARKSGLDALKQLEAEINKIDDCETGVVIDLFLSYRAVRGWNEMISLVPKMSPELAATVMVQEQVGLALNRAGNGEEAEQVLLKLIAKRGPTSETCGILGRIYKDRWEVAQKAGENMLANELLEKAIEAYLQGFDADWRDAYPGINAVTLMELKDPPDPRRLDILPVVTYAVRRRVERSTPDYWDYATLLELAILANDEAGATSALASLLTAVREPWEPETTARNLRLIREARQRRDEVSVNCIEMVEAKLLESVREV